MKKNKIINLRGLTFLIFGLLLATANLVDAQQRQMLTYVSNPNLTEKQQHYADAWTKFEWVSSYQYVSINTLVFNENFLTLNLPNNNTVSVEKTSLEDNFGGRFSWSGKYASELGDASFVVNKDMVTARLSSVTHVYLIYPIGEGLHVLIECNGARMPQDESEEGYKQMVQQGINSAHQQTPVHVDAETGSTEQLGGNCKIRILVVYTDDANVNLADPISFVQSCINTTNACYNNSSVNFNVELAAAIMEVYAESLNSTTDKTRLHDTNDGYLDDVHDYRNYFDADMCIMITENLQSGICGEAYTVANSTYTDPFCVVTRGCAVGNLSFPHELAHLYGCRHDTYVDGTTTPYAYGHGYIYLAGQWRTVMAYNNYCSDNGSSCTRLQYFSNPANTYGGVAMGTNATNDNESALEASRTNIAGLEATNTNKVFVNPYTFTSGEYSDIIAFNTVTNNSTAFVFNSGAQGVWRAGDSFTMKPGFWAKSGSKFITQFDACTALKLASDNVAAAEPKKESINLDAIQVQPNPFQSNFDVVYTLAKEGKVQIQLYDVMGKKVKDLFNQNLDLAGPYKFTFDAGELPAGIYMCVVITESGMKSIRIAKSK